MQEDKTPLRTATLNFACPNTSPFEYHDTFESMAAISCSEIFLVGGEDRYIDEEATI
jgi:hypothetical protein